VAVSEARKPARTQRRKVLPVVAGVACVGAVAFLLLGGLRSNIVYFRTVSEAVSEHDSGRVRLAGEVVIGSVEETPDGVRFEVTDGKETVPVVHTGDPPELFAEEAPVVTEGTWDEDFGTFRSDRILIRHGNEYSPPDVDQDEGG